MSTNLPIVEELKDISPARKLRTIKIEIPDSDHEEVKPRELSPAHKNNNNFKKAVVKMPPVGIET